MERKESNLERVISAAISGSSLANVYLAGAAQSRAPEVSRSEEPTVGSNELAINAIAESVLTSAEIDDVWHSRWEGMTAVRAEFRSVEAYIGYMNSALLKKRLSAPRSLPVEQSPSAGVSSAMCSPREAELMQRCATMQSATDREKVWRQAFAESPEIQREFGSADVYSSFMEGTFNGRLRIWRKVDQS